MRYEQDSAGEIVVIGAGLIGLAVAYELAKRGAEVRVFDAGEPGRGASWAGAGMLAPYTEAIEDGPFLTLCTFSLGRYPDFVAELRERTGVDPKLRRDGILEIAFDLEDATRLAARLDPLRRRGVRVCLLERRELLRLEPALAGDTLTALYTQDEGQVDNRRLGRALQAASGAFGVRIAGGSAVRAIEANRRRVLGVRTDEGFVAARTVINAMGAWAGQLAGVPAGAAVPVTPVKGQMLALAVPQRFLQRVVWAPGAYLVPREDGRLLVGATVEDEGFDTRVTADGLYRLLGGALRAAPALRGFAVSETWAGVRPGSADGRPYLGATSLDGYFVATGHYRNGILLAPATATLLADAVEGKTPALDLAPFSPSRGTAPGDGAAPGSGEPEPAPHGAKMSA
jgi:glycine oxidase